VCQIKGNYKNLMKLTEKSLNNLREICKNKVYVLDRNKYFHEIILKVRNFFLIFLILHIFSVFQLRHLF